MNMLIGKSHLACLLGTIALMSSGCETLSHKLSPNQLWKLNRGPELGRDTYNFSIPQADKDQLLHDLVKQTEPGLEPPVTTNP